MQDVLGDATAADLAAAWRLAFAVCGEQTGADAAAEAAVAAQVSWLGPPSSIELLSATYREVEPIGLAASPDGDADPLYDAWWGLPVDQRAALWLRLADNRSCTVAAEILSLAPGAVMSLADAAQDQLVPSAASAACPTRVDLTAYVAGSPPAGETAAIRDHLPRCDTCANRLALVERLQSLGDPDSGPVPIATDAGRLALDRYLLAGVDAWHGDLIVEEPVKRPDWPERPIAPLPPLAPASAGAPSGARRSSRNGIGVAPKRPSRSVSARVDAPQGTVAAAALAAFHAALGDEDAVSPAGAVPSDAAPTQAEDRAVQDANVVLDLPAPPDEDPRPAMEARLDGDVLVEDSHPTGEVAVVAAMLDKPGAEEPAAGDGVDEGTPSITPQPSAGKGRGPLGRWRRHRAEAASFSPAALNGLDPYLDESILISEAAPLGASGPVTTPDEEPDPGPDVAIRAQADGAFPTDATDAIGTFSVATARDQPSSGDGALTIDDWAPDDVAWAGLEVDDTSPSVAAVTSGATVDTNSEAASHSMDHLPSADLDEEAPVPTAVALGRSSGESDRAGGDNPRPGLLRGPQFGGALSPKVLAVATAAVLAAGIVGAIVVQPKGFPHFETVNVSGTRGPGLFPGSTNAPATVPPNSAPLIIIPPGSTVSSFPPAMPTSPSPSSPSPSSSSVSSGSSPATPGHTSHASGGYSGPTGATPPPVSPPRNITPTPATKPTAPTSASPSPPPPPPPTRTCILVVCLP